MITSLLIVCTGNVCRSPMAWGLFKERLMLSSFSVKVDSAGIRALVGQAPTIEAQGTMRDIGIDISGHRGKQLTRDLVDDASLILVMETYQKQEIVSNFLSARGKTFLLGEWSGFEVPDPYRHETEFFVTTRDLLECGWNDWKTRL